MHPRVFDNLGIVCNSDLSLLVLYLRVSNNYSIPSKSLNLLRSLCIVLVLYKRFGQSQYSIRESRSLSRLSCYCTQEPKSNLVMYRPTWGSRSLIIFSLYFARVSWSITVFCPRVSVALGIVLVLHPRVLVTLNTVLVLYPRISVSLALYARVLVTHVLFRYCPRESQCIGYLSAILAIYIYASIADRYPIHCPYLIIVCTCATWVTNSWYIVNMFRLTWWRWRMTDHVIDIKA